MIRHKLRKLYVHTAEAAHENAQRHRQLSLSAGGDNQTPKSD
jgi:hypothetical protein